MKIEYDDEEPIAEPPELVRVCTKCGRGFPAWAPDVTNDIQPHWWTSTEVSGPLCNGRIMQVNRAIHIENVAKVLLQISLRNRLEGRPL